MSAVPESVLAPARQVSPRPRGVYGLAKRGLDCLSASLALVLLSPVMVTVAVLIRMDSPGPALFRQRRSGRGSGEFVIFKFRTMQVGTPDLASHLMGPGSSRVTRIGKLLRRTSLDELPQLLNVVRGDMALVGPRPALYNQDDLIGMRQAHGIDAYRPGVTGWAQIHGRDEIPLDLKVSYDRFYAERCSAWLDLWILMRTVVTLFSSRGVF
jgi:O-antigen biosynthesis protein WbqP